MIKITLADEDLAVYITYPLAFDIDTFFASHKPHHPIYQGDQGHWLAPHSYLHSANQNQNEYLKYTLYLLQYQYMQSCNCLLHSQRRREEREEGEREEEEEEEEEDNDDDKGN